MFDFGDNLHHEGSLNLGNFWSHWGEIDIDKLVQAVSSSESFDIESLKERMKRFGPDILSKLDRFRENQRKLRQRLIDDLERQYKGVVVSDDEIRENLSDTFRDKHWMTCVRELSDAGVYEKSPDYRYEGVISDPVLFEKKVKELFPDDSLNEIIQRLHQIQVYRNLYLGKIKKLIGLLKEGLADQAMLNETSGSDSNVHDYWRLEGDERNQLLKEMHENVVPGANLYMGTLAQDVSSVWEFMTGEKDAFQAPSPAMFVPQKGGIDLAHAKDVLKIQNGGEGIRFHLNPAQLAQLQNAPGFVPVIINIQPMTNLRQFLGVD